MINKYLSLAAVLLALGIQACSPGVDTPQVVETAWPDTSMVLDGTNIVDVADFDLVNTDVGGLPGNYISEQGGAEVFLTVSSQQAGKWTVERVYTEPGMEKLATQYTVHRTQFGLADANDSLLLQQTSEGLIALETESGIDSIPASYWIHYVRHENQQHSAGGNQ